MKSTKTHNIRAGNKLSSKYTVIFGVAFAIVGAALLLATHAAGFTTSFEAENSTKNSPATTVSDANASGGSALKFASAGSSSCPLPAYPNASCTGVPAGTTLTPSGGMNITTAGTVIDARDISGCVTVNAPNVTIKRSRIRDTNAPCFTVLDNNSTGLIVQDSEIDGMGSNDTVVGSSNMTLSRVNIHGGENGLDVSGNMTVEDSYIHDLTTVNQAHTDGAQFNQGAADIIFRHNTIVPQTSGTAASTSCIIMWDDANPQNSRVRIENNRLDGTRASYVLYSPRLPASQIYINNNRMLKGATGGYTNGVQVGVTVTEFNGNVDDLTGTPLTPSD
jgi:hypothetical protein